MRFEPLLENARDERRLVLRVIKILEPIEYATSIFKSKDVVTEGSLLRNPENGKVLTVNIDLERHRDLGLLLPDQDTVFVAPLLLISGH